MNEITEPAAHTAFPAVQPTTRFAEIGHGGELAVDGPRGVPARVERVAGFLRRVFVFEACVDVADEVCGGRVSRWFDRVLGKGTGRVGWGRE
jgi:hypothetical protein